MMNANDRRLGAYTRILKGDAKAETANDPASVAETIRNGPASGRAPGQGAAASRDTAASANGAMNGSTNGGVKGGSARSGAAAVSGGLLKVPGANAGGGKESPFRKVAKFLLLIGVEDAAKVMSRLTPEQTERVVLEIASIRRVDPDEAAIVLAEFEFLLKQATSPSGGLETARTILDAAFGPERAAEMLRKAVPDAEGKPFDYLDDIDPDRLVALIADELPAVKALVLSRIKPATAAEAIKRMSPAEKNDTVIRLAKLKAINPDVLRRVDTAMREKVKNLSISSVDSVDGRKALAEILRHMDGSGEKSILDRLAGDDPELGRDLRERLFTIDDVVRADDRFVQETLKDMTERDIALLVAGKAEPFRKKVFANVSRTRGAMVLEEEKIASPVSRAEADRVTASFFGALRRAWEQGKLIIGGRDSDDVWV